MDALSSAPDAGDEWATAEGSRLRNNVGGDEDEDSEEGEEAFECVACRKTFRSEAAWDSHARSKKHLKEMEVLRQEMLAEEEELGLAEAEEVESENGEDYAEEGEEDSAEEKPPPSPSPIEANKDAEELAPPTDPAGNDAEPDPDDSRPKPRRKKGGKSVKITSSPSTPIDAGEDVEGGEGGTEGAAKPELSKKEKRRLREAAKKERSEAETAANASALQVRLHSPSEMRF